MGYTRYDTTAVWVGYDMPRELENLKGATYPGAIWKDFMEKLHQGLPYIDFKKPYSNDYEALPKNYLTDSYDIEEQYIETDPPPEKPVITPDQAQPQQPVIVDPETGLPIQMLPIDQPLTEVPMEEIPLD